MTSLPPSCGNSLSDAVLADAVSFETITDLSIRLSRLIRDGSQLLVIQLCVHFSLTYISAVYIKETKWTPGKHEMKPKATTHGWKEECKNANVQLFFMCYFPTGETDPTDCLTWHSGNPSYNVQPMQTPEGKKFMYCIRRPKFKNRPKKSKIVFPLC